MTALTADADLARILRETRTVAVVGISANPIRPSHEVYSYLAAHTPYRFYLVNPTITELGDAPVYPSLAALPETPDLVDVFRRTDQLPGVLADVLALTPRPATLWLQSGLTDAQVAADATAAGVQVVMNRCLKIEYARLA